MEIFRIILLLATATAAVNALKCYECSSEKQKDCYTISKGQTKHLVDCSKRQTQCSVMEFLDPDIPGVNFIHRKCESKVQKCSGKLSSVNCCLCRTDGCNDDNLCTDAGTATVPMSFGFIFGSVAVLKAF